MLCDKCGKNEATVRIYYEVNGITIHRNFCDACAGNRCDGCGSTYDDIVKSGKCGCSHCYEKFYEQLLPQIKKLQGSIEHRGKIPTVGLKVHQNDNSISNLRDELKLLIEQENYEQAAIVRDKIKLLEAETL
ncbi:MAG: UvrB/UvrC motif-containing protein [Clostridia bacterium]|nr:UvrB/UvrC motif-containing protein [Clostridia bacterium]